MGLILGEGVRQIHENLGSAEDFFADSSLRARVTDDRAFDEFRQGLEYDAHITLSRLDSNPLIAMDMLSGENPDFPIAEAKKLWTKINDEGRIALIERAEDFGLTPSEVDRVLGHLPAAGLGRAIKAHVDAALLNELPIPEPSVIIEAPSMKIPRVITKGDAQGYLSQLGYKHTGGTNVEKWVDAGGNVYTLPQGRRGQELRNYDSRLLRGLFA